MELTKRVIERYKLTALLVTHQVKDVINYGNRAIQLKDGKIIRDLDIRQKNELQMNEVYEWFGH
jgi:putative ABC transport system ATP-binding protein